MLSATGSEGLRGGRRTRLSGRSVARRLPVYCARGVGCAIRCRRPGLWCRPGTTGSCPPMTAASGRRPAPLLRISNHLGQRYLRELVIPAAQMEDQFG